MNRFFSGLRLVLVVALFASFSQARASTIALKLDDAPANGAAIFAVGANVTGTVSVSGMAHPATIQIAIDANHSVTLQAMDNNTERTFTIATNALPADTYTVTATNTEVSASTPPATAPLNLVNSPRLQYQKAGAWLELPDVLYLQRGSNLIFRALPAQNPTVAFPAGKPTWSAAGTGATVTAGNPIDTATAHFTTTSTSATDFKTVSADGIGANVRTAKIIVFTIAITRGANAADISEPQANPQSVMVGAKIDLKAIITPTALQGALTSKQWGLGSGDVVKGYNLDAALPANPTDPPTQKTLLAETDLVNDTVAYYYTNGDFAGQSVTVNFSGKINDVTVAATVKFKVFRPRIVTVTENGAQVSSFIGNFSTDVEGNDPYSA